MNLELELETQSRKSRLDSAKAEIALELEYRGYHNLPALAASELPTLSLSLSNGSDHVFNEEEVAFFLDGSRYTAPANFVALRHLPVDNTIVQLLELRLLHLHHLASCDDNVSKSSCELHVMAAYISEEHCPLLPSI